MCEQIVHQPQQVVVKTLYPEDVLIERSQEDPESFKPYEVAKLGMIAQARWVASIHAAEADMTQREADLKEYRRVLAIYRKLKVATMAVLVGVAIMAAFALASGAVFESCEGPSTDQSKLEK